MRDCSKNRWQAADKVFPVSLSMRHPVGCYKLIGFCILYCLAAFVPLSAPAAGVISIVELTSPDGHIRFAFQNTSSGPQYSIDFKGTRIVDHSPLGLSFQETGDFQKGLVVHQPIYREGEDKYDLVVGKTRTVHDFYREVEIPLEQQSETRRRVHFLVRVFNDGVAFRYLFPQQNNLQIPTAPSTGPSPSLASLSVPSALSTASPETGTSFTLIDENTCFRLAGDPILLASFLPGYTSSHEGRYARLPFSEIKNDTLMDMPVFITFPNGSVSSKKSAHPNDAANLHGSGSPRDSGKIYMAITEAQLLDYAGMYLVRHGDALKSELSPLPKRSQQTLNQPTDLEAQLAMHPGTHPLRPITPPSVKVKATLPHRTPWRVLLIGDRPGKLIESNIITSLNDPCAIKDVSWIRPGKTDFHWWNGDIVPDTTFPPGINFETNQYYIDFCARNNLEYHSVIGYGGIAWYTNDGVSYQPGPHSDVTRPLPGLDMGQLCEYAKNKGVGIRVWVHWQVLYPMIDSAFEQFEKWGIQGMMVDFMDRDDQEMVNIQTEILQKAARHHLHIQFHGAYKPTGLSRTWPNEFTREGTLNYENDKWNNPITPEDDINVVFTRLLAGPTDYHLGGFRAVSPADYIPQYTRPLVLGTRCHMLAMYVILESYLGMVCDYPAAYEGQPGFDFIRAVPTTWDETRVPQAVPGQWVMIARRKKDEWFTGAINNGTSRQVRVSLDFLPHGTYAATLYQDGPDAAANPNHLTLETRQLQSSDTLTLSLAPGGGQVMRLKKITPPN